MKKLLLILILLWGTVNAQPNKYDTFVYASKLYSEEIYKISDDGDEWNDLGWGNFTIYFYQYESPDFNVTTYWQFIAEGIKPFILEEGYEIINVFGEDSLCYNISTYKSKSLFIELEGIIKIITCNGANVLEMWNFKTGEIIYFDGIQLEMEYETEQEEEFLDALEFSHKIRKDN